MYTFRQGFLFIVGKYIPFHTGLLFPNATMQSVSGTFVGVNIKHV